jgi:hypothetical protein
MNLAANVNTDVNNMKFCYIVNSVSENVKT